MMTGPVKRFAVFAYPEFYPGGGWTDYEGSYDTKEEAMAEAQRQLADENNSYADVVDLHTGEDFSVTR